MQPAKQSHSSASADTRLVPIVVRVGGGKNVALTGDFNGWTKEGISMQSLGSGRYKTQLRLAPGSYQFRLLVDGEWADDQDAERRVANPFGTQNSVLQVS
ncbi:MAG TPA: isoamylase early set domain-containing protein [Planctomycetota bacterium]|nr:isoamylase early set domain-containing protein [Planctomycetota bacterium]